jgi:hypothetical protein
LNGFAEGGQRIHARHRHRFRNWRLGVPPTTYSFAIAPKQPDQEGKLRIEVFNPCDGSDDQKTPTAILFSDEEEFLDFGVNAIQKYAEIIEDGGAAYLFQNVFPCLFSTRCTCCTCTPTPRPSTVAKCRY